MPLFDSGKATAVVKQSSRNAVKAPLSKCNLQNQGGGHYTSLQGNILLNKVGLVPRTHLFQKREE